MFIGQGSFSHINPRLRGALEEQLGPLPWHDARRALNTPLGLALSLSAAATRRPECIGRPRQLNVARVKTTPTFDLMSRNARRAVLKHDPRFVVQTQGLFDASTGARPLFIYTDYTEHANLRANPDHRLMPERWLRRERRLYHRAEAIFAASSTARRSLIEDYGVPERKVVLTHTGINVTPLREVPQRPEDGFHILFVGGDWERKGGPELLRAFHLLRADRPDATLTVLGCTPGRPPPGARYLGKVSPDELHRYLAAASILCLPAHQEPAGIAYSDASAWGLPVVATTAGDIPDRILHEQTGLLVQPGDVAELHAALLRLSRYPELRAQLGEAGHRYTLEQFTWPRIAATIASEIRSRLGQRPT